MLRFFYLYALHLSLIVAAIASQAQQPEMRASILADSLLYQDQDQDGVVNKYDVCIDQAGPAENDGCPEQVAITEGLYSTGLYARFLPYADVDRDGVANKWDQCVEVPGLRTLAGCPAPQSELTDPFASFSISEIRKADIAAILPLTKAADARGFNPSSLPEGLLPDMIKQSLSKIVLISHRKNSYWIEQLQSHLVINGLSRKRIQIHYQRELSEVGALSNRMAIAIFPL